MSNVIAFVSIKGGVGKTTLALETAASLVNEYGKKVLLIDANFSAPNIGLYLDLTTEETLHDVLSGVGLNLAIYEAHGIDVVPANLDHFDKADIFKLKKIISKFKARYDFIILDSSPNHEELKPVIAAADRIFIVTSPDHVTLLTSLKAAQVAKRQKTPIEGILVNRIRSPRHEYDISQIEKISKIPVFAKIPDHKNIARAIHQKTPISVLEPKNKVSKEISNFASALCGKPEKPSGIFKNFLPFKNLFGKEIVNRELMRQDFYRSQL